MLANIEKKEAFCFWCNKWINAHLAFLSVLYGGSITCDKDHLIGNESDPEWQQMWGYDKSEDE